MSDPLDIIAVPGQPGHYGRRAFVDALVRAGNPPLNSSLRLTDEQQRAWDAYQAGTGSPADDPSRPELFPLAHVRGVAGDITPTPERVAALEAQGLVRPYDYEPWHWQLPGNVRIYPLVTSIPASADTDSRPFPETSEEDDEMKNAMVFWFSQDRSYLTVLSFNTGSGWHSIHTTPVQDDGYNERFRKSLSAGETIGEVTFSHGEELLRSLGAKAAT